MFKKIQSTGCGCGGPPPVTGSNCDDNPFAAVPKISTHLTLHDRSGSWKARWSINRMNYLVASGLYQAGRPDKNAPVLVTANYKMSFDRLRKELTGIDAWIMVLDTKGINVWCAAGKGTFGTAEIIERIRQVRLTEVVGHRTMILPQLGAPGVSAHEVKKATGFKVIYGPVRAADIPAFLKAGQQATAQMRQVRFSFLDRLVLTPIELVGVYKYLLAIIVLLLAIQLVRTPNAAFLTLLGSTLISFLPFLGAAITGGVLTPILLPFIPGRAFAWKGWLLGFIWSVVYVFFLSQAMDWPPAIFYLLVLPIISSFMAMNFTGASTYTSLSGVVKEMKTALPVQIVGAGAGVLFLGITVLIDFFK